MVSHAHHLAEIRGWWSAMRIIFLRSGVGWSAMCIILLLSHAHHLAEVRGWWLVVSHAHNLAEVRGWWSAMCIILAEVRGWRSAMRIILLRSGVGGQPCASSC